MNEYKVGKTQE